MDVSCVPWGKLLILITELQWKPVYKALKVLGTLYVRYLFHIFNQKNSYQAVISETNIKVKNVPVFKIFFHTSTLSCLLVNNFTQKMLWEKWEKEYGQYVTETFNFSTCFQT